MVLIETANEFENWCVKNGYSKAEVARILGVTRQTIYNLTHSKPKNAANRNVSAETQKELADFEKIPPMLSLSLLAIEHLGPEFFGSSQHERKPSKRRA